MATHTKLRFGLRALLAAVALACCLAAVVGCQISWIRQRRAFRMQAGFTFIDERGHFGSFGRTMPRALGLLGEYGVPFITMEVLESDLERSADGDSRLNASAQAKLMRAHSLFPEASIHAVDESGDVVEDLNDYRPPQ